MFILNDFIVLREDRSHAIQHTNIVFKWLNFFAIILIALLLLFLVKICFSTIFTIILGCIALIISICAQLAKEHLSKLLIYSKTLFFILLPIAIIMAIILINIYKFTTVKEKNQNNIIDTTEIFKDSLIHSQNVDSSFVANDSTLNKNKGIENKINSIIKKNKIK